VLPFHEELGVSKIYGINTVDITYKLPNQCLDGGKDCLLGVCEYKTTNQNNEIISCNNKWVYKIKQDPKCYCYTHKLLILTKILAEKKLKEKEAKLVAKLAAKAEVKAQKDAAKELAKLAAKAQKDAVKAASKAQKDAAKNAPSSSNSKKPNPKHQSTTLEICTEILKSGKNAGTQCPCKALLNGKCGRHTKPQISATNAGENIIISSNPPAAST
jgi:stress response protein YsnF